MVHRTKRNPVRQNYTLHLAKLRMERGLSQLDLARKCGIKKLSVAAYENGYHEPGLQALVQMACALDLTSLDQLITYNKDAIRAHLEGEAPTVDKPAAEIVKITLPPESEEVTHSADTVGAVSSGGEPEGTTQ